MEIIEAKIKDIVNETFDVDTDLALKPTNKKFGDYSTNVALRLAKQLGISPQDFCEKIQGKILEIEEVKSVSQKNGHINIVIDPVFVAKEVELMLKNKTYKKEVDADSKLAIVEFPSPNMAKPFSVGHLRSANQGWAAKQILEVTGWRVITDNHIGDYGTPFGIWVVGYKRFSNETKLKEGGIYELGRIYIETRKLMKEEALEGKNDVSNEVQAWFQKLNSNDPEAVKYHKMFYDISLNHMHTVMKRLGIYTDYEYGEASYVKLANELVDKYIKEGIFTVNKDSSVIVELKEFGIDTPMLMRKSNGLPLYATTDLGTLVFRKEKFNPDLAVYVVGNEQQFYFRQLFALAKKVGIDYDLYHLSYGLIEQIDEETGKRQKMSSRKGTVLLEELLDQAESRVKKIVKTKDIDEDDVRKIAVGAIKFRDFAQDRTGNYLFEWDTIFNLTGFSGPYIQYATVRINKILRDNEEKAGSCFCEGYDYESEKDILLKLNDFPKLIQKTAENFAFHSLALYLYDLAKLVNVYYDKVPILKGEVSDEDKKARIGFLNQVSQVLTEGLDILGIEVPVNM